MTRDSGETLAEVLVTIAILGLAITALLGGLATTVNVSARHRGQTTATTLLLSAVERVKAGGFRAACAPPAAPTTAEVPRDADWTITVSAPKDAVTGAACSATTTVQQVTVRVTGPGYADESVDVLLRNVA